MEQQLLSQILDQLGWIRLHLQALIAVGVVFVILMVAIARNATRPSRADFARHGQELLHQEKYREVIALGNAHLAKFPGDAHSQWLVAQAQMRAGNLNPALLHARKAQQLQPDWEATYTGAFISHVEQELARAKAKPDLKVVAPDPDSPPG